MNNNDWGDRPVIVELVGPDHPDHPNNQAARAAEAARKAAEAAASAQAQPCDAAPPAPPTKKRNKRRNRRRIARVQTSETSLSHHERHCSICNHEDREAIDEEFVNWFNPEGIADCYDVEWRAIYRHAHATGLFTLRERNLRGALGHIVEQASSATPTIGGVLRAIRAYSCLDRDGQWTEMPSHVVVSSGSQLAQAKVIAEAAKTLDVPSPADQSDASRTTVLLDNEKK